MEKQINCRVPEKMIEKIDMVIKEEKKYPWKGEFKQSSIVRAAIDKFVTDYENEEINHTHFSGILLKYMDVKGLKALLKKAAMDAFGADDTEASNEYLNMLKALDNFVNKSKEGE